MRRIASAVLLLCLGTAPVLLSTPAFAASPAAGGSICGTVWQDVNGDGIHEANEPAMAGVGIGLDLDMNTSTDVNGKYCFTDLTAGTYTLQANDLAFFDGGLDWTRPGRGSHVDWTDGTSAPITVHVDADGSATHLNHFDVGYVKSTADLSAHRITFSQNGERVRTNQFHVGDTFEISAAMKVSGNIPDSMGGELTLPDGLTILSTGGDMTTSVLGAHEVFGQAHGRLVPGSVERMTATVRVDSAFTSGDVTLDADLGIFDTDPSNDVLTTQISAS